MASFRDFSARLRKLCDEMSEEQRQELLCDYADGTCTEGHDNDGSTGYEIFCNGFDLARKAGDRDVWQYVLEADEGPNSVVFFVGTEAEVAKVLRQLMDENPSEEA